MNLLNKILLLLAAVTCLLSCSPTSKKKSGFDYQTSDNPWIDAFKDQVFFACLKESYPNDSIFRLIEKRDVFNPYDGLNPENLEKAKHLGQFLSQNIPPASMCEGCADGQNYYMATCLHYYASSELDSIARAQYRKYKEQLDSMYKK